MLELVLLERNIKGEITGKQLSVVSDRGYDLWAFFEKHSVPRKKKAGKAATKAEAEKVLKNLAKSNREV